MKRPRAETPPEYPVVVEPCCVEKRARVARKKRVSFSVCAPVEHVYSIYGSQLTDDQRSKIKHTIWYSRHEFDTFLQDRVHTLRAFRRAHGNHALIENHFCLRGLEMYQSPSLNAEMHSHRFAYTQCVLKEQARQRGGTSAVGKNESIVDAGQIQAQVAHMSQWAMQRAQRLAQLDAKEAGHHQVKMVTPTSSPSRRPFKHCRLSPKAVDALRRNSMTSYHGMVDVHQLKQWNTILLRQFAVSRSGGESPQLEQHHFALRQVLGQQHPVVVEPISPQRRHSMLSATLEAASQLSTDFAPVLRQFGDDE